MAKKRYHEGNYEGRDERRRMEREDGDMINEDHNAIANLPKEVIMKEYPRYGKGASEGLDDTMRGIDHQIDSDEREEKRDKYPEKY